MPELGPWSRRLVKTAVASVLWRAAVASTTAWWAHRPLIVGYHRVVEDFDEAAQTAMPSLLTSRRMFAQHLEWLGREFEFVSLDDIYRHVRADQPFERPVAAVTFDDGYEDVFEHAWPLLRRKGVPATVFVVSDYSDRGEAPIHDRLYAVLGRAFRRWDDPEQALRRMIEAADVPVEQVLPGHRAPRTPLAATRAVLTRLPQASSRRIVACLEADHRTAIGRVARPMTWDMLREMRRDGATIGSHSKTHAWLVHESPERVREELVESKAALERVLGEPVHHFAYPDGQFTVETVRAVARAGYQLACTTCRHRDGRHPRLTLPRLMLWEYSSVDAERRCSPAILACQARGLIPSTSRCLAAHV